MPSSKFLVFGLLALLSVAVRLADLAMPLERDEGEYAYAAQEMRRGFMPYRDTFCQKPPVVFFWYLLGFQVFGESATGIHLTLMVAAAAAACGLFLVVERLTGRTAGLLAAGVFVLGSAETGYFGSAANTEIFMLVPVLFGVHHLLRAAENNRGRWWLLAGVWVGLATLTKQVALFSFLGPFGFVAAQVFRRRGSRALVTGALWMTLGVLASVLPILAWLYGRGVWPAFIEAAFTHNLAYVGFPFGPAKWLQLAGVVVNRFGTTVGLLWLGMLVGILALTWPRFRSQPALWFGAMWFVGSLLGVALGPYGFGHYFLQVLPPLALMAGVLGHVLGTQVDFLAQRRGLVTGLFAAVLLLPPALQRLEISILPVEVRSYELYKVYGLPPFVAAQLLGEHLRQTTAPEDKILIIGSEPEILFYARRRSATRYTIFYPLTGDYPRADAMIEELFAQTEAEPPARIILCYCPTSFISGGKSSERQQRIFTQIGRVLRAGYQEEARFCQDAEGRVVLVPTGPAPPPNGCLFQLFTRHPHVTPAVPLRRTSRQQAIHP